MHWCRFQSDLFPGGEVTAGEIFQRLGSSYESSRPFLEIKLKTHKPTFYLKSLIVVLYAALKNKKI